MKVHRVMPSSIRSCQLPCAKKLEFNQSLFNRKNDEIFIRDCHLAGADGRAREETLAAAGAASTPGRAFQNAWAGDRPGSDIITGHGARGDNGDTDGCRVTVQVPGEYRLVSGWG